MPRNASGCCETSGQGWLALGGLLGDEEKLRIYKNWRIEGSAIIAPETPRAPRRSSEPVDSVVAGARYARVCTLPVPLMLPVEGRVGPRAASQ